LLLSPIAFLGEGHAQSAGDRRGSAAVQNVSKAEVQPSKVEAFKAQRGKLIITDSRLVAKVPDTGLGLEVRAIALWEFGREAQKARGVEFRLYGRQSDFVRVDLEDLPEISKACRMLQELSEKWKDQAEPSAEYQHRSGLSISIYRIGDGPLEAVLFFHGALVQLPVNSLSLIAQALDGAPRVLGSR
jgi:hypothetical protein